MRATTTLNKALVSKRLGKNLQALRKNRGLTQEQLAERLNTAPRYIQAIEAGKKLPSLLFILKTIAVLEVESTDLLR